MYTTKIYIYIFKKKEKKKKNEHNPDLASLPQITCQVYFLTFEQITIELALILFMGKILLHTYI